MAENIKTQAVKKPANPPKKKIQYPEERRVAVHCRGIKKSFRTGDTESYVLRGIDLDVYEGELFMLVGPSGCGKTTFLSMIAGILHCDEGSMIVQQNDYKAMTDDQMIDYRAKNVGFIFQSFNLIPTLTIEENVSVPLVINGVSLDEALIKAREILAVVGLGDRARNRPTQLSGGQQQRVAIARALLHNPSVLVCDEPTSALDHDTGILIMDLMREINRKSGTTFIVVTHDSRIFGYADRIARMNDGRIEKIEIMNQKNIHDHMDEHNE